MKYDSEKWGNNTVENVWGNNHYDLFWNTFFSKDTLNKKWNTVLLNYLSKNIGEICIMVYTKK